MFALMLPALGYAQPKDYTKVDPRELGVAFVEPKKEGNFIVGGKNATTVVASVAALNGRPIDQLELDMRPGANSSMGFLGKDESLLGILALDNKFVVDQQGLSHQDLARPLLILGAIAQKHAVEQPLEILYHGKRFRLQAQVFRGFVQSPFNDGTKANCEASVLNVDSGKRVAYSLLVPHMIERYGFYEGQGTRYRVPPQTILEALDFIQPPKKR